MPHRLVRSILLDPRTLMVHSGLMLAVTGSWYLGPWDTFDSSPAYRVMAHVASEWAWGLVLVFVGLSQVRAAFGTRADSIRCTCLAFAVWLFRCVLFALASPRSGAAPQFAAYALLQVLAVLRS